jgi:hypothetical protein
MRLRSRWTPNRPEPSEHPWAVATAISLALLAGITGLLAVLALRVSTGAANGPEGMASFSFAAVAAMFAMVTSVLTGTAAIIFGLCGAWWRAAALGIVTVLIYVLWNALV